MGTLLIALIICWPAASLRAAGSPSFDPAVNYSAETYPESVTTGDFNGDGKSDLAVANAGSDNVSILLGNGDGTFVEPAVLYGAGGDPYSITVGDFNADGKTDLAVANDFSADVSILLGNGDGTFAPAVSYGAGNDPTSVTTGDFNADGKTDLAVANAMSNDISILLGNGDGTFAPAVSYGAGSTWPASVTTGDFDADGNIDLAVANYGDIYTAVGEVSILLGVGDGTFAAAVNYAVGDSQSSVTTGDFNADGKIDLAVTDGGNPLSIGGVSILLGNGDGTFAPAVSYGAGNVPSSVTTGDFNADGKTDLAVANTMSNDVSILLGTGSGAFALAVNFGVGLWPGSVTTGDFNADGKTDLAVANGNSDDVSVLLNDSDNMPPYVVSITRADPNPTNAASVGFTVTFSESVTGVDAADFSLNTTGTIAGASVTSVSGGPAVYTVSASTGTGDGSLRLDIIGAPSIQDLASNPLPGPYTSGASYTIDKTAPTVAMSSTTANPTNASPIPVSVTFSRSVTGFDAGDIVAANGAVSNFTGSGASYSFDLTPAGQGLVSADIAAGVATDAGGIPNTAATQFSRTYDTVAPGVAMSSAAANPTSTSPIPVSVTFSESVTGFDAGDIVAGNGAVSNFAGSGASYSFDLTPAADGPVTADIAAGVATDAAGNPNTAAAQFSRTYASPPSVAMSSAAPSSTNTSPIPVSVTFSRSVTGFDAVDIVAANGAVVSNFAGSGASYSFDLTPAGQGLVTADIAAGVATDAGGIPNTAATQFSRTYDTVAPGVAMSSTAANPTNASPIPVSVTFSESVTGFDAVDIVAGNGAVSNLAGSGASYSFDLTPDGQGPVSADIAGGVATDAAGIPNTAATQFSRTYDSVVPDTQIDSHPVNPSNSASANFTFSSPDVTVSFSCSLDGGAYTACTSPRNYTSLGNSSHTFAVRAADAAGNVDATPASFTWAVDTSRNYYWTWYDSISMQNWVLMANPSGASHNLSFDLSVAGNPQSLADSFDLGAGVVPAGKSLPFSKGGLMNGPVQVTSKTGDKAIVSQRSLMGNSFEEVLGTESTKLSDHYYWTWYDQQSPGMTNWVLVANPTDAPITYQVKIAGVTMPTTPDNPGTIPAHGKVTPTFAGKMDGPVEVTASANVIASQRVLSNFGTAFNEVPGIPATDLSTHYYWTWYDQQSPGMTNWVLVANPSDTTVTYQIKIAGVVQPTTADNPGTIPAHGKVTPTFAGKMDGPVEVTASANVIASQRIIAGPSFEEVPGYAQSTLTSDYHWTWYDQKSAGSTNWVLVANPGNSPVTYQIKIAGQVMPTTADNPGAIPAHGKVTPTFAGKMDGPVEVVATGGNVMVSQRVLWNGYFNEVLGTVLD